MSDQDSGNLEPISAEYAEKLIIEFSDYTIVELVLEIKEGREALEQEKKAHAVDEFARNKLQVKCDDLKERIRKAELSLSGEIEVVEETE